MADNRKRAPRGGKQAASGSRPIRRNDRAAAPKGQRERSQAARPQRERSRDNVQVPKGEFIEGRRAAAEALRTGFPIKCALIAEGGERDAALSHLVDDLNAAGVRIKYVPRAQLDALSSHGAHQGIALEVGNFPYADVADISNEEAMAFYDKYAKEALELMLAKNHDYDEAWRCMRVSSYTDLILMKIYRTKQIESLAGHTLVSEGIDANYMDMINYSVFGLIKIEFEG